MLMILEFTSANMKQIKKKIFFMVLQKTFCKANVSLFLYTTNL